MNLLSLVRKQHPNLQIPNGKQLQEDIENKDHLQKLSKLPLLKDKLIYINKLNDFTPAFLKELKIKTDNNNFTHIVFKYYLVNLYQYCHNVPVSLQLLWKANNDPDIELDKGQFLTEETLVIAHNYTIYWDNVRLFKYFFPDEYSYAYQGHGIKEAIELGATNIIDCMLESMENITNHVEARVVCDILEEGAKKENEKIISYILNRFDRNSLFSIIGTQVAFQLLCSRGNDKLIRLFMEKLFPNGNDNLNVNYGLSFCDTGARKAFNMGHINVIKTILEFNTEYLDVLRDVATKGGFIKELKEIVEMLYAKNPEISWNFLSDILEYFINENNEEMTEFLASKFTPIQMNNYIDWQVSQGNLKYLQGIKKYINPEIHHFHQESIIDVSHKNIELFEFLFKEFPSMITEQHLDVIYNGALIGRNEAIIFLLINKNYRGINYNTILEHFINTPHFKLISHSLKYIFNCNNFLIRAVKDYNYDVVKLLVEHGADNIQDALNELKKPTSVSLEINYSKIKEYLESLK